MNEKIYEFETVIKKVSDIDGAYIEFPYDVRKQIGKQHGDIIKITIKERE